MIGLLHVSYKYEKNIEETLIVPISDLRIEKYAEKYSKSDSDELKHLIASSNELLEYIDMLSGPIVGGLLQQINKDF